MPIPNRYYESVKGWSPKALDGIAGNAKMHPITDKVRQVDYHGHFTAAAGHALYTARTYPKEYWNKAAFVCEPTGHLVATFMLERKGSDFTSRNAWNLLASDDEWSAPIMAEVGPDGNVWVIDWYNYIVQHNPTPAGFKTGKGAAYETDLRDKTHGRIYRLVMKGAKPLAALPNLKDATPEKLVATLKNDNMLWRLHAQRLLVERGKRDVLADLIELVNDASVDDVGLNAGAIHALWVLNGLDAMRLDDTAKFAALNALLHKSAGVRRNAVLAIPNTKEASAATLKARLWEDQDAHVRLATLLAYADMETSSLAGMTASMLFREENTADRWIPDALTCAGARHNSRFLRHITGTRPLLNQRGLEVVTIVAEHYARVGPAEALDEAFAPIVNTNPAVVEAILNGLAKGWPRSKTATFKAETEDQLLKLLPKLSPSSKAQLLKLASIWGVNSLTKHAAEAVKDLLASASNEKHGDTARVAAAKQYVEFQSADSNAVDEVLALITPVPPLPSPRA